MRGLLERLLEVLGGLGRWFRRQEGHLDSLAALAGEARDLAGRLALPPPPDSPEHAALSRRLAALAEGLAEAGARASSDLAETRHEVLRAAALAGEVAGRLRAAEAAPAPGRPPRDPLTDLPLGRA